MARARGMTAARWKSCRRPDVMLGCLRGFSDRKLRLFACACCRHAWDRLPDERSRQAVEVAERFADGGIDTERLAAAAESAFQAREMAEDGVRAGAGPAWAAWYTALSGSPGGSPSNVIGNVLCGLRARRRNREAAALCDLFRCLFGNPYRPAELPAGLGAWRGGLLAKTARRMYDARDFADLPILADMLEDAGCTDARVLAHGRGPGPHARGCFILDALLGLT